MGEGIQTDVDGPPLEPVHVGPVEPSSQGQSFLGESAFETEFAEGCGEAGAEGVHAPTFAAEVAEML